MNTAEQLETPHPQMAEMIRVQDLHAFYGESHILHGVNFDVKRGELVFLGHPRQGGFRRHPTPIGLAIGAERGAVQVGHDAERHRLVNHTLPFLA